MKEAESLKKYHFFSDLLEAARDELSGKTVKLRPDGNPFDHINEVYETQRNLLKRIDRLKRELGNPKLTPQQRKKFEGLLGEASRLLDYSESFSPRTLR